MADDTSNSKPFKKPIIYDTIEEPVVLRDLLRDDIFLLGGQFAILCQWAQPGLAKGTASRSNFATRIANRLKNTARFLNVAVYGTTEEKEAIFSVIHRYHASVIGDDYDANDPELHKWTAATLFVAVVVIHELILGKLPREKLEVIFKESAIYGTSLRMPPEMWPATLDDFWEYWNHNIATLEVTEEAKKLSVDLLYPSGLPLRMRMLSPVSRLVTVHILPERLAKEYGLEQNMLSRAVFQGVTKTMSVTYPWLPSNMRQALHQMYMEDMKKAVQTINDTGHWMGEPKL